MSGDRWLSCQQSVDALIASGICLTRAKQTLLQWAANDQVAARARVVQDGPRKQLDAEVPTSLWSSMRNVNYTDWPAGIIIASNQAGLIVRLVGVEFSEADLRKAMPPPLELKVSSKRAVGRKPAKWWAQFAVELAVYFHNKELPEGQEADGIEKLIDEVMQMMGPDDDMIPGRSTIQDVVREVLVRLRDAGN